MLKKLLLAVDGSADAMRAAEMARDIAKNSQGDITILVVAPKVPILVKYDREKYCRSQEDELYEMKKISEEIVANTAKLLEPEQIPFKSNIISGDAAEIIIKEAENEKIDLIIMGTRGQTGISRFLLGSVSSKVVAHAPCSVLVVR